MRDLTQEHADTVDRKYAYDFDMRMHGYMIRSFGLPSFSSERVLEMGCYKGAFAKRLTEIYKDVTVVEGVEALIDAAHEVAPDAEYHLDRFENFKPDGLFDAVFLLHTLEHLDNPQLVLRRIKTWLAPGGKLYVAVPNAYAISRQIACAMGLMNSPTDVTEGERAHGHRRTYTGIDLSDEVTGAGFTIEKQGGIFFKPMANFQMDAAMAAGVIDEAYLEGCYLLGKQLSNWCASLYVICA